MLGYIEFLKVPSNIALVLVGMFLILQIIGEILEFKGQIVPEFIKIRKYFYRRKKERETIQKMAELMDSIQEVPELIADVKILLNDVNVHYNSDNIMKRDKWIENVNRKLEDDDRCIFELNKKMDKNNEITLSLLIDSKRNEIINFASRCADENSLVTKEQYNRIFKVYNEYEKIIEENGMTNGEVDIAHRIISESYENHMRTHTFIEDIRGYEK